MDKIDTDCKWRTWKIQAKIFKMHKQLKVFFII